LSLQARKKEIIAAINKMVNQFNENNKQIKENNKTPKTEKEMNDLIQKNKEIQDECKNIDDKVNEGKLFAEQIDERLNNILDPTIPELDAKYDEKNGLIDECDDLFDICEDKLKAIDANLNDQLNKVEQALERLNEAGPINNPSASDRDNKEFLQKVQDLTD
jgi:chromosome segregation ATPase